MFIFRAITQEEILTGATLFLSITFDSDIILSWLYYNEVLKNDAIETKFKDPLLVFTVIGTLAWLFIASDGILYKLLYPCLAPIFVRASNIVEKILDKIHDICCPSDCLEVVITQLQTAGPKNYYSPGWFSLIGIVFSDVALVGLTFIIDNNGEEISALGAGNIASSVYNLLVKFLDAYDSLNEKRPINRMVVKEFNHKTPISQVLQFNNNLIITVSVRAVKLWDIALEECRAIIKVKHISWVAKLDTNHILVGQDISPFIQKFDVSGNQFTPVNVVLNVQTFVCNLDPIINAFPGRQLAEWINFVSMLPAAVGNVRVECAAKYDNDSLIGGTNDGKVLIWEKDNPNGQFAAFDARAYEGFSFLDCKEKRVDGGMSVTIIVTIDFLYGRREWTVHSPVNYATNSLTLVQCFGVENAVNAVTIVNDGTIVEGARDGSVLIRDWRTNTHTWVCKAHFRPVTSIVVLHDGALLSGSVDGTAVVLKMPLTSISMHRSDC